LLPAQDHKRVGEGDRGPNTGGMGAYTPLPWLPQAMVDRIVTEVCEPVAREMVARGCGFSGLLYAGLAITSSGPEVVEFNCRFGDPETQAVLALLESPLGETLHSVATGRLADLPPLVWRDGAAVTVVLAAEHYPATPRRGDLIEGAEQPGVLHAGTARDAEGRLVSAGGRVLSVVGTGADLTAARAEAYRILDGIELGGGHFRRDIGQAAEEGRISLPG
jgi:phosphoribosylamine--glycine ligase